MNKFGWYLKHLSWTSSIIDNKFFKCFFSKYVIPRKCNCLFCGKKFHSFTYHGYESIASISHNVFLGGRLGDCPYCKSIDKHRWLWYVMHNYTDIEKMKGVVLHFAPEGIIRSKITKNINIKYISGDLMPGRADYIVDMTNMQFQDNSIDVIIASMVLEHISDEKSAFCELKRVLKPNGKIILTIPVAFDLEKTLEDEAINTDELRLKYYGQKDHVRLYGNDYKKRFEKYGLYVKVYIAGNILSSKEIKKMGYPINMPVIICTKT